VGIVQVGPTPQMMAPGWAGEKNRVGLKSPRAIRSVSISGKFLLHSNCNWKEGVAHCSGTEHRRLCGRSLLWSRRRSQSGWATSMTSVSDGSPTGDASTDCRNLHAVIHSTQSSLLKEWWQKQPSLLKQWWKELTWAATIVWFADLFRHADDLSLTTARAGGRTWGQRSSHCANFGGISIRIPRSRHNPKIARR
jgi:hypothetical protein